MQKNNLTKETIDNTRKLWEEKPLTDDEIQDNIYNAIKRFYNSKGYNDLDVYTLTMRKIFTL